MDAALVCVGAAKVCLQLSVHAIGQQPESNGLPPEPAHTGRILFKHEDCPKVPQHMDAALVCVGAAMACF